jgi:putative ABC transport system permease protein
MSASDKFRRLFRLDRGVRDVETAVNDEFSFHFDMTMRELLASGMTREAAEREALHRFGDVEAARTRVRDIARDHVEHTRRVESWSAIAQDMRYALRGLRANPVFTVGVVLTLGLGIGANATMFGIVDRLLLRPPAFLTASDRVGRVYLVRNDRDGKEQVTRNLPYKRYADLRQSTKAFDAMAPYFETDFIVGEGQDARELLVVMAGAEFWPMFSVKPVLGRSFIPSDDAAPNGSRVTVLGYGFWQTRFGGSPDVLGKELRIGAERYTIVGVAPRGFNGASLRSVSAFVPFTPVARAEMGDFDQGYGFSWLEIIARRKPGVSVETASRELTYAYERSYAEERLTRATLPPISSTKPRAEFGSVLTDRGPETRSDTKVALWLFGVTGIVLLIAAANVAGLLLARAIRRRREIAVRIALGVGRTRLFTMLIVESLLLATLGAVAGLAIAEWGGRIMRIAMLPDIEWTSVFRDGRVLGVAAAVAIGCGLLAGIAPIIHAGRTDLAESMRGGNRDGGRARSRLRDGLLLFQAALSVVLLVGAGLFVSSLRNARMLPLGYDVDRVIYMSVDNRGYDRAPGVIGAARERALADARLAERSRLLAAARAIPGVESASVTWGVPFWMTLEPELHVPGIDSVNRLGNFIMNGISGDYFTTTGTRILRGRPIEDSDLISTQRVAVISREMGEKLWPGQDPLGKCITVSRRTNPCANIVGISEGIVRGSYDGDEKLQFYVPMDQFERGQGSIYIRTRGPATEMVRTVRAELQKQLSVSQYANARSLSSIIDPNLRQWSLGATMFTLFGALALVLAGIGLYSVISYSVAQRKHEMGVRVALGASSGNVVGMVMSEGLRLTVIGLLLGAGLAFYGAPYVEKLLYNVDARDPRVFVGVAGVLLVVASLATLLPAWRASRVDPQEALRTE